MWWAPSEGFFQKSCGALRLLAANAALVREPSGAGERRLEASDLTW
jgi:hypothetical protein